jgi:hypothetical protein
MGNTHNVGGDIGSSYGSLLGRHLGEILATNFSSIQASFLEPFYVEHAKEFCIELDVIKPEAIFIDASVSNTKVASRFTKLKHAITFLPTRPYKASANLNNH